MDDMLSRMDPSKLQKDFAEHVRTGEPMPAPTTEFQRDTLARGEMAERLRVAEARVEEMRAGIKKTLEEADDRCFNLVRQTLRSLLEAKP